MSDIRDALERERRRHTFPEGTVDDVMRRRDRHQRNRRLGSAVAALAIAVAGIGGGLYAFRSVGSEPVASPQPTGSRPSPAPSGSGPTVTPPAGEIMIQPSGPLQFVDDQHGWAVVATNLFESGQLFRTMDAGTTWAHVEMAGSVDAIQFVSATHGWALTDKGLYGTTDGGVTWSPVGSRTSRLLDVQFIDDKTGWAIQADHALVQSSDGGVTWTASDIPSAAAHDSLCADQLAGKVILWVTGGGPDGFRLDRWESGGSWTDVTATIPASEGWTSTVRCGQGDAWVQVQGGGAAGHIAYVIYRTVDGGPELQAMYQEAGTRPLGPDASVADRQDPYPGPFVAFDASNAVFIGWCPPCDNRLTAHRVTAVLEGTLAVLSTQLPVSGAPAGVSFTGVRGWALVYPSGGSHLFQIVATTDGGQSWSVAGP
jgi:photosystem II stability/assembly factor-like uncharacterized protein